MPRERYDGGAEPIAEAIRPLVERYGRSFVTYPDEGDSVDNAKVIEGESGVNEKHHDEVLSALYKLANNLSFPKSVVLKALDLTYIADWKLTKQQKKDWRNTICNRLRNLCRVVSQGFVHKSKASWFRQLSFTPGEPEVHAVADALVPTEATDLSEAVASAPPAVLYRYGFDVERSSSLRCLAAQARCDVWRHPHRSWRSWNFCSRNRRSRFRLR